MIDCAVLIAAQEWGLFKKHGLDVTLTKEAGWATIRGKLLQEEYDAVHAPASLSYAIHCGIGTTARPCLTAFVLGLNGSAITLSDRLWRKGVRDASSLRALIEKDRAHTTYRFGAVLDLSPQDCALRDWLTAGGIDPDQDVSLRSVPSPIMHRQLLEGHLDGYCAAEPWNSIVIQEGAGWIAAASSEIAPGQPENILLVLEEFAQERAEEHLAMIAALIEASAICENPANRPELIRVLAQPRYLDVPGTLLERSLLGTLKTGRTGREIGGFITLCGGDANVPDRAKGRRVFDQIHSTSAGKRSRSLRPGIIGRIFREDLHALARQRLAPRRLTASPRENPQASPRADAGPAASQRMAFAV